MKFSTRFLCLALSVCFTARSAQADPCGMVPPIHQGQGQPITRIGEQQTYVFYKDGVEYSFGSAGSLGDGHPFLLIGAHPSQARFFKGIIDEVYAYDEVLSGLEIGQIMEGVISAVNPDMKLSITWGGIKASR